MSDLTLEDLSVEDRKALPHNHPLLDEYAARVGAKHGLPDQLLNALKNAGEMSESVGKNSVSPKNAKGVMQFIPGTAKRFEVEDPTDPLQAIDGAGRYVEHISKELNTTDPAIIAAGYNSGENRQSLRDGRIPLIPETQAYSKRVKEFMGKVPPALPKGFTVDDLDPADRAAFMAPKVTKADRSEYSALSGNKFEDFAAGVGKSVVDTGTGLMQLMGDAINPVSRAITGRDLVKDRRGEVAETQARDQELMESGAGLAGNIAGNVALTALPAGAITKAATLRKAGTAVNAVLPAAAAGAALSATAPVATNDSRGANMAIGAALGPVAAGVAKGVGAAANAPVIRDIVDGAKAIGRAIPGSSLVVKPSFNASANPSTRAAVNTAMAEDVPVYASQLKKPGSNPGGGKGEGQRKAFDRAVARTFGEDTDDLAQAFPQAKQRLGDNFNALFDNKYIPLGKDHLTDLSKISAYNSGRSPRFPPNADLQDLVDRAAAAAATGKPLSGRDYQNALQDYKAAMTQMGKGTDTSPADYHAMQGVAKLIDALNVQANKVLTGEERELFKQSNKQWRNMVQLETLAPKDLDGSINPKQLAAILARKRKGEFVYGKGDQTLPDLARFGNTFMDLSPKAPKGLVNQLMDQLLPSKGTMFTTIAGGLAGGQTADHVEGEGAVSRAMPYALGAAGALAGKRAFGAITNPRLVPNDLTRPRGALSDLLNRSSVAGGAGLAENATEGP